MSRGWNSLSGACSDLDYRLLWIDMFIISFLKNCLSMPSTFWFLWRMHNQYVMISMVYRKKYQWEKVPSGICYFVLRKKYHIGTFSYWYFFPMNDRKKYHKVFIIKSIVCIFLNFKISLWESSLIISHRLMRLIVVLTKRLSKFCQIFFFTKYLFVSFFFRIYYFIVVTIWKFNCV